MRRYVLGRKKLHLDIIPIDLFGYNSMLYPIQTLWGQNVLFQEFPDHLNVNATL